MKTLNRLMLCFSRARSLSVSDESLLLPVTIEATNNVRITDCFHQIALPACVSQSDSVRLQTRLFTLFDGFNTWSDFVSLSLCSELISATRRLRHPSSRLNEAGCLISSWKRPRRCSSLLPLPFKCKTHTVCLPAQISVYMQSLN